MMLYKNKKVKAHSHDGDTDFFGIVADLLQRDTLGSYQLIIRLDYVLWMSIDLMKENEADDTLHYRCRQCRWHSPFAHTQAESQLHSLEQTASVIGRYVNANKTEYMYFNQKGDISTLNGGSLKLVNKFMYLSSSISSMENEINMHLAKAWTAIDSLSELSDRIKGNFFPSSGCVNSTIWMHRIDANKAYREKARRELHKNATSKMEQILEATSHKRVAIRPLTSHL